MQGCSNPQPPLLFAFRMEIFTWRPAQPDPDDLGRRSAEGSAEPPRRFEDLPNLAFINFHKERKVFVFFSYREGLARTPIPG